MTVSPDREGQVSPSAWHRVYLGYAPGVGKTYAMLGEARRRRLRGTDVVVGWVETYDRPQTAAALGELEVVAPRILLRKGVSVADMDVEAIRDRRPQLAIVDELAHANVAGSRHLKRYQDVLELLSAGISIMSTLNIQQLASLQDTLRVLTGTTVTETLPDWVLDAADELEMVDISPETVRKRVRRGQVLPAPQIEQALRGYFQTDTLLALRELTLRRVASHASQRSGGPPPEQAKASAETILVCLPASRHAMAILRRGVHLAEPLQGRLLVLHVTQSSSGLQPEGTEGYQEVVKALQLARALGAEVVTRNAPDVVDAIVTFAAEVGVTQLVLGEGSRSRWWHVGRQSMLDQVLQRTQDTDVHIVRRSER